MPLRYGSRLCVGLWGRIPTLGSALPMSQGPVHRYSKVAYGMRFWTRCVFNEHNRARAAAIASASGVGYQRVWRLAALRPHIPLHGLGEQPPLLRPRGCVGLRGDGQLLLCRGHLWIGELVSRVFEPGLAVRFWDHPVEV